MKKIKLLGLAIILVGLMANNCTWAHGGGGHGGGGYGGGGGHYGGGVHYGGGGYYGGGHYGGHYGGWGYGSGAYYGGIGLGLGLGYGLGYYGGYPYYNGYPYYSYPPVVTVPVAPPVYIQQSAPAAAQQYPAGYWYHCSNPEGYYPYVKTCPNGWQQVEPKPPAPL